MTSIGWPGLLLLLLLGLFPMVLAILVASRRRLGPLGSACSSPSSSLSSCWSSRSSCPGGVRSRRTCRGRRLRCDPTGDGRRTL